MERKSQRAWLYGILGGILHILLLSVILFLLIGDSWLRYFYDVPLDMRIWTYISFAGAFLIGLVPTIFYLEEGILSTAVIIVLALIGSTILTISALSGPEVWVGPLPIVGYILVWFITLPTAMAIGGVEFIVRKRMRDSG